MQPWILLGLSLLGAPATRYSGPESGRDPCGFTCSGLVYYLLTQTDFLPEEVPVHTNELFDGFGVLVHEGLQRTGDLVFLSNSGSKPTHVGFYVGRQDLLSFLASHPTAASVNHLLCSDVSLHFILESPGVSGLSVALCPLQSMPLARLSSEHPQLYLHNPIGYKRPAHLHGRYHRFS